jgi:hypothetical protein
LGSLPLALAADPLKANSNLHGWCRPDHVPELAMEVGRLRAQEVAVTELCLLELDLVNNQQHPLLKVCHFSK